MPIYNVTYADQYIGQMLADNATEAIRDAYKRCNANPSTLYRLSKFAAVEVQQPDLAYLDHSGRVLRCDKYPLKAGDQLTLFSGQVSGTLDNGYVHSLRPCRYFISKANDTHVTLQTIDSDGSYYKGVSVISLRAVLGEWSEYQIDGLRVFERKFTNGANAAHFTNALTDAKRNWKERTFLDCYIVTVDCPETAAEFGLTEVSRDSASYKAHTNGVCDNEG